MVWLVVNSLTLNISLFKRHGIVFSCPIDLFLSYATISDNILSLLNCYWCFNKWMTLVIYNFYVFYFKIENAFEIIYF
ncbi:DUF1360 domain-containing protein [Gemella sp.]